MKMFSVLYDKAMTWSKHRHAPRYLAGLSFAESSFFPIPPDVMLAPMALSQPQRAWFFAGLTTFASIAGGILGYMIGLFFYEALGMEQLLMKWGYWDTFVRAGTWFDKWGFWAILAAGFTPIPYKLFTISAGAIAMSFIPFVIASFIGRGARFYLVCALMVWGGEAMEAKLRRYIDWLGWLMIAVIIVVYWFKRGG